MEQFRPPFDSRAGERTGIEPSHWSEHSLNIRDRAVPKKRADVLVPFSRRWIPSPSFLYPAAPILLALSLSCVRAVDADSVGRRAGVAAGSASMRVRRAGRCGSGQREVVSTRVRKRAAQPARAGAGGATRAGRRGRRLAARPREVVGAAASTRRQRWAVRPRKQARATASERADIGGVRRRAA